MANKIQFNKIEDLMVGESSKVWGELKKEVGDDAYFLSNRPEVILKKEGISLAKNHMIKALLGDARREDSNYRLFVPQIAPRDGIDFSKIQIRLNGYGIIVLDYVLDYISYQAAFFPYLCNQKHGVLLYMGFYTSAGGRDPMYILMNESGEFVLSANFIDCLIMNNKQNNALLEEFENSED
jgi:hypothetical protein